MYTSSIFGKIISRKGVKPDILGIPEQWQRFLFQNQKQEIQAFLGIFNDLIKFFPSIADIYKALRQLTSVKTEWTWNPTYQKLFDKAKSIIKVCVHEILWWNQATIPRNRCIWSRTRSQLTADKKWHKLSFRYGTRAVTC